MPNPAKLAIIVLCFVFTCGCNFSTLPPISGHHWKRATFGANLYADDGHLSASFVGAMPGNAVQVCDFDHGAPCQYFESDRQALNWLQKQYW